MQKLAESQNAVLSLDFAWICVYVSVWTQSCSFRVVSSKQIKLVCMYHSTPSPFFSSSLTLSKIKLFFLDHGHLLSDSHKILNTFILLATEGYTTRKLLVALLPHCIVDSRSKRMCVFLKSEMRDATPVKMPPYLLVIWELMYTCSLFTLDLTTKML